MGALQQYARELPAAAAEAMTRDLLLLFMPQVTRDV